ncbi:MAG: sigma-E processing peptidase SpoIIGA [Oscillospiraceae bacterium]|nr:sigma-E processing peptidase SpoIIGA [Oscillospiraceae bacterium]
MSTIYVDLLVIINIYITYFLLRGTAVFLHRSVTRRRLLLGSVAGGLSSLIILLPTLLLVINAVLRIAVGGLIVFIAFGWGNRRDFLKNALFFMIVNVVFAGFTLMLWFFAAPLGMEWTGGVVYFDVSLPVLIVTTAFAYGLIRLLRYIMDVKNAGDKAYRITITMSGKAVELDAIADSGNMLTDYFTGLPVIVVSKSAGLATADAGLPRLLPYNTIDSAGLISVYRASNIVIKSESNVSKPVNALIGITDSDKTAHAIFNPKLLI